MVWVKTLLAENQLYNINDSEEEINPDPLTFFDRNTMRLLYDILNVKLTNGTDFQTFFDLLKSCSEQIDEANRQIDDFISADVLDIFIENFLLGFTNLIHELGFDVISDEIV